MCGAANLANCDKETCSDNFETKLLANRKKKQFPIELKAGGALCLNCSCYGGHVGAELCTSGDRGVWFLIALHQDENLFSGDRVEAVFM